MTVLPITTEYIKLQDLMKLAAVSYTHLTLPTNSRV